MDRLLQALRSPGAQKEVVGTAPTQHLAVEITESSNGDSGKCCLSVAKDSTAQNITGYSVRAKSRLLDRWLDRTVQFSGSPAVFVLISFALLTWVLLAIPFHDSMDWQVVISDIQALVSYIFDSFLMRQLLNEHEHSMVAAAEIRSRNISHERMLKFLVADPGRRELVRSVVAASTEASPDDVQSLPAGPFDANLPAEGWFGRLSTAIAHVLGHMGTVSLYWVCIFVWLGFGQYCGWSNMWQLYINSGTSALMVFVFSFLANINERHDQYTQQSLNVIYQVDSALELKLRLLTGDSLDNQPVVLPPPRVNPLQRAIYYYADVVGTLVGIVLLLLVTVIWVAIGPAMSFNSNWWLLIGTYAGLIGLNDGFVLRNVQAQLRAHENEQFVAIEVDDAALFGTIDAAPSNGIVESSSTTPTLTHRLSRAMGRICAHEMTVLTGFLLIVGLLIGASAMGWSTTGQLLCNVPPSIIESFFMVVLITGHNLGDTQKRIDLQNIYHRRLQLLGLVQRFEAAQLLFTEKMAIPAVDQLEELAVDGVVVTSEVVSVEEVTAAAAEE